MNTINLRPFQTGVSGNPNGRPVGSRNIKSIVRDLLNDPNVYEMLPGYHPKGTTTSLEAIIRVLMIRAIKGDTRAADVILKYAVGRDAPVEIGGFFSREKLVVEVVGGREEIELLEP